ncbi:MAG TPA: helix-turn-helix domain-containing protein [Chloroflexota bacterium]|nr:helix-turn-helix domain-containing protein [Chloroflexota bacterium]
MESPDDTYQLETVEQMRTLADPLRLRIIDCLSRRAMTATQLGAILELPANKVHYHVRELERVGLVRLVETREKSGILEKYFRLVAHSLQVPESLLQAVTPDESVALAGKMLNSLTRNFLRAFAQAMHAQPRDDTALALETVELSLTNAESRDLVTRINALLKVYEGRQAPPEARPRSFVLMTYPALGEGDQQAAPQPSMDDAPLSLPIPELAAPAPAPRRQFCLTIGGTWFSRKELEAALGKGRALDIHVVGYLGFADDISPDLADRAIARVRHIGVLTAPSAVREVLRRKGAGA